MQLTEKSSLTFYRASDELRFQSGLTECLCPALKSALESKEKSNQINLQISKKKKMIQHSLKLFKLFFTIILCSDKLVPLA